jgi:putative ABC transport system permease protein
VRLAGLPLRNCLRHPGRTLLTAIAVAAAVIAFLVIRAAVRSFELGGKQAQADRLGVRHRLSFTLSLPQRYIDEIRRVPGVSAASFAIWFNGKDPREPAHVFTSFAVDAASWLEVRDELRIDREAAARWLADRGSVILGAPLAERLGVGPGSILTLRGTVFPGEWRFTVAGVFTETRATPSARHVYLHWHRVEETLPEWRQGRMGWAVVRIADATKSGEVARAIDARFADRDVRTVTLSERAVYGTYVGLLSSVLTVLDLVTAVLAAVILVIVGGAMATSVRERTAEIAVLRALGFTPATIATLVLGEGALLGGLGGALGALASVPIINLGVGRWIEDHLSGLFPSFELDGRAAVVAVIGAAVAGALAAISPAARAARLPAAEALRLAGE